MARIRLLPDEELDDADSFSGRLRLLWEPSDTFRAHLTGQYFDEDINGAAQKGLLDETRDNLLRAAEIEFGDKGFHSAAQIRYSSASDKGLSGPTACPHYGSLPKRTCNSISARPCPAMPTG